MGDASHSFHRLPSDDESRGSESARELQPVRGRIVMRCRVRRSKGCGLKPQGRRLMATFLILPGYSRRNNNPIMRIPFAFLAACLQTALPAAEKPAQGAKPTAAATTVETKSKPAFQYQSEGIEVAAASADEPKVAAFGPETIKAARKYLDDGAVCWVREKSCVACHSTGVYMVERSVLTDLLGKPSEEVRKDFVDSIPKKPGGNIQSVWRSSGLASWDKFVTGKLGEATDRSLRHTVQCISDEGFIKTIAQVEIPYITTDFELTVQAARAFAAAPGWLAGIADPEVLKRVGLMKSWLRQHEAISDYELALKLQLASLMPDLVPQSQRDAAIAMLWRQQLPDGGWSTRRMSDLMKWHVTMDPKVVQMIRSEPDAAEPASDPYMTAFAIVLLREAGIATADQRIQKGVAWLKVNQRISGRWWMKSLFRDTYHFSTYISTAGALRALALCGEVPKLAD